MCDDTYRYPYDRLSKTDLQTIDEAMSEVFHAALNTEAGRYHEALDRGDLKEAHQHRTRFRQLVRNPLLLTSTFLRAAPDPEPLVEIGIA